jgi:uncharacterized protein (TIGR03066 family)
MVAARMKSEARPGRGVPADHPITEGDIMRAMLGCAVAALCLGAGLSADDKKADPIDAKKLIGKWESKEFKEKGISKVAEFAKDGKAVFVDTVNGNETRVEGTYKVDGDKLVVTVKVKDKERKHTTVISKLTGDELVGTDEKGFEGTWVRVNQK